MREGPRSHYYLSVGVERESGRREECLAPVRER